MASWFRIMTVGFTGHDDVVFRFSPKKIYDDNAEMQSAYLAQHVSMRELLDTCGAAFENNFIVRAGLAGIKRYEEILGIVPDVLLDDIELRRKRGINKLALTIPYTETFLRQYLEAVFGAGKWALEVDPVGLTLYVYIETDSPQIYNQTVRDIAQIIPANLGFTADGDTPYTHRYLNREYTHEQMTALTFGELSKYANL